MQGFSLILLASLAQPGPQMTHRPADGAKAGSVLGASTCVGGWTVPPNSYVGVLTPISQNGNLFGNRVVAGVIRL